MNVLDAAFPPEECVHDDAAEKYVRYGWSSPMPTDSPYGVVPDLGVYNYALGMYGQ